MPPAPARQNSAYVLVPTPSWRTPARTPADTPEHSRRPTRTPSLSPKKKKLRTSDEDDDALNKMATGMALRTPGGPSRTPSTRLSSAVAGPSTTVASLDPDVILYQPHDEEVEEDSELEVPGEIPPDETSSFDDDDENVPVRTLDDFTIYGEDGTIVPVNCLLYLVAEEPAVRKGTRKGKRKRDRDAFFASGVVKAKDVDDEEEALNGLLDAEDQDSFTNEGLRVKVGPIRRMNVHYFDAQSGRFDPEIYLLTECAWYILRVPSEMYTEMYKEFLLAHQVTHALLRYAVLEDDLHLPAFLEKVPDITLEYNVWRVLERSLIEEDFDDGAAVMYAIATIPRICSTIPGGGLSTSPLLSEYFTAHDFEFAVEESDDAMSEDGVVPVKNRRKMQAPKTGAAYATPTVLDICQEMYRTQFEGTRHDLGTVAVERLNTLERKRVVHEENPDMLAWADEARTMVSIDGEIYKPGEVVVVVPHDEKRVSTSANMYAKAFWFCVIRYFFEDKKGMHFHGQWLEHGSQTLLQQQAHANELFLLSCGDERSCEDHPLATIVERVNVEWVREVVTEYHAEDKNPACRNFRCAFQYNPKQLVFYDLLGLEQEAELLEAMPADEQCVSCAQRQHIQAKTIFSVDKSDRSFMIAGEKYHALDIVFVRSAGLLFNIAQILKLPTSSDKVHVQFLDRVPKPEDQAYVAHDRHITLSDRTGTIPAADLQGHCHAPVMDPDEEEALLKWTSQSESHFYITEATFPDGSDFEQCQACLDDEEEEMSSRAELLRSTSKLRALELFAGAGGLGTGMEMSGYIKPTNAVEFMESAARTYEVNHPDTQVFCQDVSAVLEHVIERDKGEDPASLVGLSGQALEMPRRGEVDIISGGPPCQAFSLANYNPKADDHRAMLPMTMLSFVEYYEPRYFILENVRGMLYYSLMALKKAHHGRGLEGGVKMGVVKTIMRTLLSLGYQCSVKLLQAGHYGAPQDRKRIIIMGAKRGVPLPPFPPPTHAFGRMARYQCPEVIDPETGDNTVIEPVTRSKEPDTYHMEAPLKPVSVDDATGDLPEFDWSRKDGELSGDAKTRLASGIPQFCAQTITGRKAVTQVVGFEEVEYATEAQTFYQRAMRDQDEDSLVTYHETKSYSENTVDLCLRVPLTAGASHRDIPDKYLNAALVKSKASKSNDVRYGRLDGQGVFQTALTGVSPAAKGKLLHPHQRRTVSVREAARSQGFPDSYEFLSVHKSKQAVLGDQYKQIGNAVPVPLAAALARSIGETELKFCQTKAREASPVL